MTDRLLNNDKLRPGESIISENEKFALVLQEDGNLVLYQIGSTNALWASGTNGKDVDWAVLQEDGNFVIYGEGKALWASGTFGNRVAWLVVQDDGNVVIYHPSGTPLWDTKTVLPIVKRLTVLLESMSNEEYIEVCGKCGVYVTPSVPRGAYSVATRRL